MEDLSEKEQLEALRAWWAENGSYVVGGIIVGMLIIFGWNQWQSTKADTEVAASTLYEDVMEAAARGNLDAASAAAGNLFNDYPDSPYAAQARLAMARLHMDNGRDLDAANVLRPLADSSTDNELALIARLRLAKILLYQDKADDVVSLVHDMPETAFAARFNEVLGDAYVALGEFEKAEAAYVTALNDSPLARTVDPALIQLKLNDLPAAGESAGNETALSEEDVQADEAPADDEADVPDADVSGVVESSAETAEDEDSGEE
ncbi:MAG: tetratricopeptide repeat protein [Gammaproteobacteria bacterium]|nr:tetratricopeptide repeat protein [Gammaproteobacteria bacterium]